MISTRNKLTVWNIYILYYINLCIAGGYIVIGDEKDVSLTQLSMESNSNGSGNAL